ncbi:MAG: hypothetical protein Q8M08_09265 [Bacteroidales bacterium]|nr:hypothetical protein [Bacteroidales bacterium]
MNPSKTDYITRIYGIREATLLTVFLLCNLVLFAQAPSLSLGTVGVCKNNTTILVPLTGANLYNIGAITLFISYNDSCLAFNSIQNIDPQLNSIISNTLSNPSRVAIVWSKTSGANFNNTTLLDIKFDVIKPFGNLDFITDYCEIANVALPPEIIDVTYTDGSIYEATPTITLEPESKTITSQSNVVFQIVSPNASGFSWQENRNDGAVWSTLSETNTYSGTQTNSLIIRKVPVNYNQFKYRCILNPTNCPTLSANALLTVDSLTGITGQPIRAILNLTNSPNPFSLKTTISYTVPENGFVTIKMYSMTGQIMNIPVESPHLPGSYQLENNFVYLPAGIYFCQYVFKSTARVYETYRKLIKIN